MIARRALIVVAFLVGGICAADDKKDDHEQLQGEWVVASAEVAGKESENLKGKKLVLKGDEWTPPVGGTLGFKIDAARSPKQLDLTAAAGEDVNTWRGIYKIDGDTLTFCRSVRPGGERPDEFKGGPGVALMVFKRAEKK